MFININISSLPIGMWPDNWTAVTKDGAKSSQFEHTFLVTENGVEIMTGRGVKKGGPPITAMPDWEDIKGELEK